MKAQTTLLNLSLLLLAGPRVLAVAPELGPEYEPPEAYDAQEDEADDVRGDQFGRLPSPVDIQRPNTQSAAQQPPPADDPISDIFGGLTAWVPSWLGGRPRPVSGFPYGSSQSDSPSGYPPYSLVTPLYPPSATQYPPGLPYSPAQQAPPGWGIGPYRGSSISAAAAAASASALAASAAAAAAAATSAASASALASTQSVVTVTAAPVTVTVSAPAPPASTVTQYYTYDQVTVTQFYTYPQTTVTHIQSAQAVTAPPVTVTVTAPAPPADTVTLTARGGGVGTVTVTATLIMPVAPPAIASGFGTPNPRPNPPPVPAAITPMPSPSAQAPAFVTPMPPPNAPAPASTTLIPSNTSTSSTWYCRTRCDGSWGPGRTAVVVAPEASMRALRKVNGTSTLSTMLAVDVKSKTEATAAATTAIAVINDSVFSAHHQRVPTFSRKKMEPHASAASAATAAAAPTGNLVVVQVPAAIEGTDIPAEGPVHAGRLQPISVGSNEENNVVNAPSKGPDLSLSAPPPFDNIPPQFQQQGLPPQLLQGPPPDLAIDPMPLPPQPAPEEEEDPCAGLDGRRPASGMCRAKQREEEERRAKEMAQEEAERRAQQQQQPRPQPQNDGSWWNPFSNPLSNPFSSWFKPKPKSKSVAPLPYKSAWYGNGRSRNR